MNIDVSKIVIAATATEDMVGQKGYFGDNLRELREKSGSYSTLKRIDNLNTYGMVDADYTHYVLFYPYEAEEAEEELVNMEIRGNIEGSVAGYEYKAVWMGYEKREGYDSPKTTVTVDYVAMISVKEVAGGELKAAPDIVIEKAMEKAKEKAANGEYIYIH